MKRTREVYGLTGSCALALFAALACGETVPRREPASPVNLQPAGAPSPPYPPPSSGAGKDRGGLGGELVLPGPSPCFWPATS
jgi:hypothetical protein